ncbi:MAG: sirohydrochlorin cobaltochelatase [Thaumarchaeota archaeon]|nr:sirohydrochlorin cobaltochelatase [Nitrososphaerota archaeon]MBT5843288.1 sirohydrochlorin cobaltochelatase [Nitrososphaerota archaeon]MBT6468456.1 sirohydrochlorin cobaltochelatase [Nitrososphaerota archaeon]
MKRGLLIIDRGSREREASEELETICHGINEKRAYFITDYCFLEVEPPYIEDGISKCLKNEIESLTIVPYFLYPGKKVKIAIKEVEKLQKDTKVKFLITKPMSMHKTLVEIVENRISTTLKENNVSLSNKDVDVMIIGHGSKDPNAQTSLDYIVNELNGSYRNVSRCWLEIEQPDIFEGIKKCEKDNPKVLIIVFYFLHEGAHVKTDINNDLIPALEKSTIEKAYITKHLGTDQKMIDLIIERAKEVEDAN